MKRALIVSYHFSPDPSVGAKRPTELVKSMTEDGWHVTVLTRNTLKGSENQQEPWEDTVEFIRAPHLPGILNPSYTALKRLTRWIRPGTKDRRAASSNFPEDFSERRPDQPVSAKFRAKRMIISGQALMSATKGWLFAATALMVLLKIKGRRYDVVISSSPPASVHFLAWIAKSFLGGKWILDLRDPINLWELVKPVCMAPHRVAIENWLEKRYLASADQVVVTTELLKNEMVNIAARDKYKFCAEIVYNGFDGDIIREGESLGETFELAFAGELYANRNPFPLFIAIRDLLESGEIQHGGIRFHLYGNCATWNGHSVWNWIQDNQLQDVILLHGMLTPDNLEKELVKAHLLVSYAQQQPLQIPAKTFDYIRYPCKSLVITEEGSSTGEFVTKNGLGYASDDDGVRLRKMLLLALNDYKKSASASLSEEELTKRKAFSRAEQNKYYLQLIESISG